MQWVNYFLKITISRWLQAHPKVILWTVLASEYPVDITLHPTLSALEPGHMFCHALYHISTVYWPKYYCKKKKIPTQQIHKLYCIQQSVCKYGCNKCPVWRCLSRRTVMFTAFMIWHPSCFVNGGSWAHKTHSHDDDSLIWNMSPRRTNVWMRWERGRVHLYLPTDHKSHFFSGSSRLYWDQYSEFLSLESWASLHTGGSLFNMFPVSVHKSMMATWVSDHPALFPDRQYKPYSAQSMTPGRGST